MAYNPKSKRTNPKGTPEQIKSLNVLTANKNIDDIRALSKISNDHNNSINNLNSDVKIINGQISSLNSSKQGKLKLTTNGFNGPSTLFNDTLNIPDYSSAPAGLFAQTAKSVPVTNTTQAQSLIYKDFERRVHNDGGLIESISCIDSKLRHYGSVGGLSVPANTFRVGDSFRVELSGYVSCLNNQPIGIRVIGNGGSTVLALTAITLATTTNKVFYISINFTIRKIGPAGTASIVTSANFTYSKDSSNSFEGSDFMYINDNTFDTTIDNTLDITAQWANASVSNSIHSETFTLNKIF